MAIAQEIQIPLAVRATTGLTQEQFDLARSFLIGEMWAQLEKYRNEVIFSVNLVIWKRSYTVGDLMDWLERRLLGPRNGK